MLSRKSLIAIGQKKDSCWIASALQAIVDCPILLKSIFSTSMYDEIEERKKRFYKNKISDINNLIKENNDNIKENSQSIIDRVKIVFDYTKQNFLDNPKPLEKMIEERDGNIFNIPEIEGLYSKIFNDQDIINQNSFQLSFWYNYDFFLKIRKYLYALVNFNSDTQICLDITKLRNIMLDMQSKQYLYSDVIYSCFVEDITNMNDITYFISLIFQNIDFFLINHSYNFKFIDENCKQYNNISIAFSIPTLNEIEMYHFQNFTMQELIIAFKNYSFNDYFLNNDFLIIYSQDSLNNKHIITEKKIIVNNTYYNLCSVIIRTQNHFFTLTTRGLFDDGNIQPGEEHLNQFCRNGYYNNPVNTGILWFYEKEPEMELDSFINFTENIQNCVYDVRKDEALTRLKEQNEIELKREILIRKQMHDKEVYIFQNFPYFSNQFTDYRSGYKIRRIQYEEFKRCQEQQMAQELSQPVQPEPSRFPASSSAPSERVTSPENDFTPREKDLTLENGIPVYFKRFNVEQMKIHPDTNISKYFKSSTDTDNAFDVINKLAEIVKKAVTTVFKKYCQRLNIDISSLESGLTGVRGPLSFATSFSSEGAAARFEQRTAQSSSASENSFWTENDGANKKIVLSLIGEDNIGKVNFSLNKDDFIKDIQSDGNTLPDQIKSEVILALDPYYFSRKKKYLKYKNKYLQIKRLEK